MLRKTLHEEQHINCVEAMANHLNTVILKYSEFESPLLHARCQGKTTALNIQKYQPENSSSYQQFSALAFSHKPVHSSLWN